MKCSVFTLFPEVVSSYLNLSILARAQKAGLLEVGIYNIRDYTEGKHRVADEAPYGGGAGMVLKPEPIIAAVSALRQIDPDLRIILTSPQGRVFNWEMAREFAEEKRRLVFICGHYEGIDQRVTLLLCPEEVSLGDYVLTGGELAALVMIDASVRYVPGVLGNVDSIREESFSHFLLEYPHYTRPPEFKGIRVPEVLLSGNHEEIRIWRRRESLRATLLKRPDLLKKADRTEKDMDLLADVMREEGV